MDPNLHGVSMKRAAFFLLLALGACDSDKTATPPTPPVVSDAGVPAPAAPRRMAFHRNPFGDALQADNLMIDGDFELTGRTDQAPWLAFDPNQGQQTLDYDTGGHCRSGIRCGVVSDPQVLVGYMGSPMLTNMVVRAYAKVSTGKCGDLRIFPIDLASNTVGNLVGAASGTPADDGWCVYEGQVESLPLAQPALYLEVSSKVTATVDEVSVLPVGETPVHGLALPPVAASTATRARVATAVAWTRAHRKYGRDRQQEVP